MKVTIENSYSTITEATYDELRDAHDICSITSIRYMRKKGQVYSETYETTTKYIKQGKIPTGLLPRLIANGIDIDFTDNRKACDGSLRSSDGLSLTLPKPRKADADYSFQEEAVKAAVKYGRGLLHYPTGSGKTVIMAKIINQLRVKTIIVVPSSELLNQTYKSFCSFFGVDRIGKLGDTEQLNIFNCFILVSTQQSLYSYSKADDDRFTRIVEGVDCLLIDECHHVAEAGARKKKPDPDKKPVRKRREPTVANSWWKVAMEIPAYYRFGMSATLNTKDSPNNQFVLESATGRVIASITTSELIQRNVLVPEDITMVEMLAKACRSWKTVTRKKDGKVLALGSYDVNILNNGDRNKLIADMAYMLHLQGRKVLILVDLVDSHGAILADLIPNSIFLHGTHKRKERDEGIQLFIDEDKILISTLVKEGFDLPVLDAIIIAGGGKAEGMLIQKLGRGRRIYPGKTNAVIYDIFDNDGLTQKNEPKLLARHSHARKDIYERVPEDSFRLISIEEFYVEYQEVISEKKV